MDPQNNQDYPDPAPAPTPAPMPPDQVQNDFNPEPVQPGVISPPLQQSVPAANQTDTLGIISLIMIFVFPFVGAILGAIGLKKANREGYKNTLSKIGLIVNSIFVVLGLLFFVLWIVLFAVAGNELNNISQEFENQSQSAAQQDPVDTTNASFVIETQSDISGVCEGNGWPSNASSSAAGNVIGLYSNRSTSPDFYLSEFASLTALEDVDFDNPTIVDTVVCLTSVGQEPIETVTCKLTINDIEVDAPMLRRLFTATAYNVAEKTEIAAFTVQPESDCPFFASVDPTDNSFDARLDEDSLNIELIKAL